METDTTPLDTKHGWEDMWNFPLDKSHKICYNKIENEKGVKKSSEKFSKKVSQKVLTNLKKFGIINTR